MSIPDSPTGHTNEPHGDGIAHKLNWLRAGVLGANDGIDSVAAIVVGVAGATTAVAPILTAGVYIKFCRVEAPQEHHLFLL